MPAMASNQPGEDETVEIKSQHTLILEKPPCCLEFAPRARKYFVVGTYNLVKDEDHGGTVEDVMTAGEENTETRRQIRDGSLILCKVVRDEIKIIQTHPTHFGILDIHFSPSHETIFAVASSIGTVSFYELTATNEGGELSIQYLETVRVTEEDIIVTSLAWHPIALGQLAITLTNGEVGMISAPSWVLKGREASPYHTRQLPGEKAQLISSFQHSLEAWTTIVLPARWPCTGLLSGGDDAVLAYSPNPSAEVSQEEAPQPDKLPSWSNRRIHGAGVTTILSLFIKPPVNRHVYLTGSYDDHLRVLSVPGIASSAHQRQPQVLHEHNLEGGVWRLKLITESTIQTMEGLKHSVIILASCMYAGAKIVELSLLLGNGESDGVWNSKVIATFMEHESMCYACDVQALSDGAEEGANTTRTILSCSFYDKRLCLWKWSDGFAHLPNRVGV